MATVPSNKKCPVCGNLMEKDTSLVYTSIPPQYKFVCKNCGCVETDQDPPVRHQDCIALEIPQDYEQRVEMYMKCRKRTLAEMLAMRDMISRQNDSLRRSMQLKQMFPVEKGRQLLTDSAASTITALPKEYLKEMSKDYLKEMYTSYSKKKEDIC